MRTPRLIACLLVLGVAFDATAALAFDRRESLGPPRLVTVPPKPSLSLVPTTPTTSAPTEEPSRQVTPMEALRSLTPMDELRSGTPMEALRSGTRHLRAGDTAKGMTALEYAAEQGHPAAQWKLGRMYADGDHVPKDDVRAFQYFSKIANSHAEDNPEAPQSRFVANAFVALGQYFLEGIPNTVTRDAERAREMFWYAASYFADPDAQYNLARMYLDGTGTQRDPRQALRWLGLAANKGQSQAQAMLGHMLFKGEHVPRQAAQGLMWLTMAKEGAGREKWIAELYDSALKQATSDERTMAFHYLESRMKGRRN